MASLEAADEIEQLRTALREAQKDRAAYRIEIDRLISQRDDARRLYCEKMSRTSRQQDCTPQWFAEEMEWNGLYEEENE